MTPSNPWNKEEFIQHLKAKEKFYHIHHEFDVMMNAGKLDQKSIQAWVANRFYYQINIPIKDAAILSNCPDREIRRQWIKRIIDQDGNASGEGDEGGIEAWLQLGDAVGLTRKELWSHQHVLPAVRFAVDAYSNFAKHASWQEGACSSLTELFAPVAHQNRIDLWPKHYPWIKNEGYSYFKRRLTESSSDVKHGLSITVEQFTTRKDQEHALEILQFKLDILWTILDALWLAYVQKKPPYWNVAP